MSLATRIIINICFPAVVLTMLGGSAWSDTVNGEWCSADGARLVIDGSEVITPGGLTTVGNYDTHHYLFTMPRPEENGETEVDIVLVTDNSILIRYIKKSIGESGLRPERWVRCETKVSVLPNHSK